MKKIILFLLLISSLCANDWKIPWLFEHPRDNHFKIIPNSRDKFDGTSFQHCMGSYLMAMAINTYLYKEEVKHNSLWALGITFTIGFLKEIEDGYREGFGRKDLLSDFVGAAVGSGMFYLLNKWHSPREGQGMIMIRQIWCSACRTYREHIIYIKGSNGFHAFDIQTVCLDIHCDKRNQITVTKECLLKIQARENNEKPEGGSEL